MSLPFGLCKGLDMLPFGCNTSARLAQDHYDDVIMSTLASKITSLTVVYSTIYSGADQSKHQSSASLAFVWGIHRGPVNSPHKWPVTRKMFPFDDVIMINGYSGDKTNRSCRFFPRLTSPWRHWKRTAVHPEHIDGLAQDCSNSSANALELLQPRTKPSICTPVRLALPCGCFPVAWIGFILTFSSLINLSIY